MWAQGPEEAQVGKGQRGPLSSTTVGPDVPAPAEASPSPLITVGCPEGVAGALVQSQLWAQSPLSIALTGFVTLGRSLICACTCKMGIMTVPVMTRGKGRQASAL